MDLAPAQAAGLSSASASASTSPRHAQARSVACLNCRRRRTFCNKERPACETCQKRSKPCIYEPGRRVTVSESSYRRTQEQVKALQEKVRAYEERLGNVSTSDPAPAPTPTPPIEAEDSDEEFEDDEDFLEPFVQLSIDRPSTRYRGPGSSDYLLRNFSQLSNVPDEDEGPDLDPDIYDRDALPSRRLLIRNHVRLPPRDKARQFFAAQYTYLGTIFAFTDPVTFDRELEAAYQGQPDVSNKDACLAYAKVLVTLAFGKLYNVNKWIDDRGPPGFEYFTQALQLLPDVYEEGSILCVETLALIGYFMQNLDRQDAAFLYIGMALRMAISLGLHQEVSSDSPSAHGLDEEAREHRRRVWWSIYSLDRILSVKSGNPVTIQDEDIGVKLPSRLPRETEYCPAVVLRHYTELSRILGEINKSIYRKSATPRPVKELMRSVQRINLDLLKWDKLLPSELRFHPAKLNRTRESVSTFCHYYQCINMTARPLLFHLVRRRLQAIRVNPEVKNTDWKVGLSPTTIHIIDRCIAAAEETIRMMEEAKRQNLLATYGYMDGEHVFSAAIILVMVCGAFPARESVTSAMNNGLALLHDMADMGFTPPSRMHRRHELLDHLRSVFLTGDPSTTPGAISTASSNPAFSLTSTGWSPRMEHAAISQAGAGSHSDLSQPPNDLRAIASNHDGNPMTGYQGFHDDIITELTENRGPHFTFDENMFLDAGYIDIDHDNTAMDIQAWQESYDNPTVNAGLDISDLQWAQAVRR